jgi:hypothetical protein
MGRMRRIVRGCGKGRSAGSSNRGQMSGLAALCPMDSGRGGALREPSASFVCPCIQHRPHGPQRAPGISTITRSVFPRPKVSGVYISSARAGGTMNSPGVVARATYVYV